MSTVLAKEFIAGC